MSPSITPVPVRLGPYELLRRIATGGMAEVYLARRAGPHGFQKLVAVKRILPQFARDIDFVAMFVDEARVCARLGHPNIVQVFDFGEHDGELYMAMEYVDGTTGARIVRAASARGEEIPLDISLYIALSLLRGLDYAHNARDEEGVPLSLVHRDVSPGNVLIDRTGAVKLTDFGIARAAEIERRTDAGQLKGKLGYMSPEQVIGRELDARSDIFTLGIVLAEMLTVRPLFSGGRELDVLMRIRDADLSAIDRAAYRVPEDIRPLLFRALARDPASRFASAEAFAQAIDDVVRRRRLQIGPSRLAAWIERLGLVARTDGPIEGDEVPTSPSTAQIRGDITLPATLPPSGEEDRATAAERLDARVRQSTSDVAPSIYSVRLEDGRQVGPLSYPRLVELFATGVAGARTQVARESGKFRAATDVAELLRFVSSPALQWDRELATEIFDHGILSRTRLPLRLFHVAVRRETGALVLRSGARRKKIYFVEGVPEFVASTTRDELLGEFLIARGQVLRMEVEMALAMLPRFGGRLGDALVGLGVLRPVELFRAIHDQTKLRFLEIFRWSEGEVGFARGARSQEETFPMGLSTFELVAEGVRESYAPSELEAMLSPMQEEVLAPEPNPPVRANMFRLQDRELRVLDAVRGRTTLSKLVAELSSDGLADPEETMRAVFFGLSVELLRSPGWIIPPTFPPKG